jgi:tetratricopeptide (TPR) repeat protein
VTLAAYLGRVECEQRVDGSGIAGPALNRASAVGRGHLEAGDRAAASAWLLRALERARARGERVREHELAHAENLRLLGDRPAAAAALEALTEAPEDHVTVLALIARAKLLEHGERDRAAALTLVRRAVEIAPRQHVGRDLARLESDLSHRLARLE